jgi:YihY family inner membrane protein
MRAATSGYRRPGPDEPSGRKGDRVMRTITRNEDVVVVEEARRRGIGRLTADVFRRFREADGMSHTRALAYQGTFAVLSGFIGLLGLASLLGVGALRTTMVEFAKTVAPGPSGQLLQEAARSTGGGTAALIGLGAMLISGALAMAQVERSANRLSGRTQDRPSGRRFVVALGIALTAGALAAIGLLLLTGGSALATGFGWKGVARDVWDVLRWIVGIAFAGAGIYLMFRLAPADRLGPRGAIFAGVVLAVVLWVVFTVALSLWFSNSSSSQTYGPLVSVIAILLWAGATSLALHLGLALTAELAAAPASQVAAARQGAVPPAPVFDQN